LGAAAAAVAVVAAAAALAELEGAASCVDAAATPLMGSGGALAGAGDVLLVLWARRAPHLTPTDLDTSGLFKLLLLV
jgi:hypothetical protein